MSDRIGGAAPAVARGPSAVSARLAGLAFLALASTLAACGARPEPRAEGRRSRPALASDAAEPIDADPNADFANALITHSYIDPRAIARISRFRSGVGHDFSDGRERCRSMKHYVEPRPELDWAAIEIFAPATGELVELAPEWAGARLRLRPESAPERRIVIFHVRPEAGIAVGRRVLAGQRLGWHQGAETLSDIAIEVLEPTYRLESYFELLDRSVRAEYAARGIADPGDLVRSRAQRDAQPLRCAGDRFLDPADPSDWIALRPIDAEAP